MQRNSEWLLKAEVRQELDRLLAERVRSNLQRHIPVYEREQPRQLKGVLGPVEVPGRAVGVECVDKADEVVRHVPWAEDVAQLSGVRLESNILSASNV